ncbi:uncharacterized protein LOC121865566 isoform X1 [Homarus americanus]|uniref:uncharacterized protein LOC121865566 isoform X1 n=1 Tax=Homarus americanus TaxID=6706 RepID=UPI001C4906F6|nr:uncharacterized protein LOC121865566 isoform X1 [Homarus americanus]
MCLYFVFLVAITTMTSALQLPLIEVFTVANKDYTIIDFIDKSYQPVLIPWSLRRRDVAALKPWTFPALNTSLEATTTFCVASEGSRAVKDCIGKGERDEEGEREEDSKRCTSEEVDAQVSLRRFGKEGEGRWGHAFTTITKDIGSAVVVPRFLNDADLTSVDLTQTGLHHVRRGWTSQVYEKDTTTSASVMCVVEGRLSLTLTPFTLAWDQLKCGPEVCELSATPTEEEKLNSEIHAFLTHASVLPRGCLYMPPEWQWSAEAPVDTTCLWFTWQDDLVIREDVLNHLFSPDEDSASTDDEVEKPSVDKPGEQKKKQRGAPEGQPRKASSTLWEALPKGHKRPLLLWGEENPFFHLIRRYLLSDRHLLLHTFLDQFPIDRILLPDLVDCPRECLTTATTIFTILDTDGDEVLTARDATYLTQDTFSSLTHHLDDLVDELKDLAKDQWKDVKETTEDARQEFLKRAKERMVASAIASVNRWKSGDLEGVDEELLKENLPDIYAQILTAREETTAAPPLSSTGREEL